MKERALALGGLGCVMGAVALLLLGNASLAFLTFAFLGLGTVLLLLGLAQMKRQDTEPRPVERTVRRGDRAVWIAGALLAGLAAAASIVTATVAVGEAIGHAVSHLVVGLAGLLLFIGVAAAWHPLPGSGKGSIRGMVLLILGVGTLGSFVESLGGAGYDAADVERRIETLASLQGVGVHLGPVALLAIPLGGLTILLVAATAIAKRARRA